MTEGYTVGEASGMMNMDQQKISQLIFAEVVVPELNRPNGRGDHALLSEKNLKELQLVTQLERLGVKRKTIKDIITVLADGKVKWWEHRGWLVVLENGWFVTDNPFNDFNKPAITRQQYF